MMVNKKSALPMKKAAMVTALGLTFSPTVSTAAPHMDQERPNIVYIMADDHACNAVSAYGSKLINTPNIDRIAARGMKFNQAMVSNSICSPSRATLLTGKYSHKNGVRKLNHTFDGAQQTFPKLLQNSGYQTAIVGKWHLKSTPTGFDHFSVMEDQGRYVDCPLKETGADGKVSRVLTKGYVTDVITDKSLAWLRQRSPDQPFCLMIHHKAPHGPHDPAPRHKNLFENESLPEPPTLLDNYDGRAPASIADRVSWSRLLLCDRPYVQYREVGKQRTGNRASDTRLMYQAFMKGYLRLIASLDENVGRVLDCLEDSGLSKNTIVIYASDNGFFNGEHGFYNKMWMYEPSLRIPLLISGPNIKAESESKEFASIMDIAPTLLDYAKCKIPEDMQGDTLRPLLEGKDVALRDAFYYHYYGSAPNGIAPSEIVGIRTKTHKLIYYPKSKFAPVTWELFDLNRDPQEMHNLHSHPKYKELREQLRTELIALISQYEDPISVLPTALPCSGKIGSKMNRSSKVLWQIGKVDNSSAEFDGAKEGRRGYLKRLGDRDKLFIVGHHEPAEAWTYILPGAKDGWAGCGYWSWRINFSALAFTLENRPAKPVFLDIDIASIDKNKLPTIRFEINNQQLDITPNKEAGLKKLRVALPEGSLRKGGNIIRMHSRAGGALEFDAVSLTSDDAQLKLAPGRSAVVQDISFAKGSRADSKEHTLIVDVINMEENSAPLEIWMDGKKIGAHKFQRGRQAWEFMVPAVDSTTQHTVTVRDGKGMISELELEQSPVDQLQLVDEVNMLAGTCNSRVFFTPGPTMPMGLVRYAPVNEPIRWKSGYDYQRETISGFVHLHEYTMDGLLVMPFQGDTSPISRDAWQSGFDLRKAKAEVGKYSATLEDSGIQVDISATKRASISRFNYPKGSKSPRVICSMQTGISESGTYILEAHVEQVSDREIRGWSKQYHKPRAYPQNQDYTVHFVMQFNHPIKSIDGWQDDQALTNIKELIYQHAHHDNKQEIVKERNFGTCGVTPIFDLPDGGELIVRTGVSLVDVQGAVNNLQKEITEPFGWKFDQVVRQNKQAWNDLLKRIAIKTHDVTRRSRFYTCLYRSLSGRGGCEDVDGRWVDTNEVIRDDAKDTSIITCDGVWGTHWNLSQLWNWYYPEYSKSWLVSQMLHFKHVGWTLKAPSGAEAMGIMMGAPEIPIMAGAWTAGIRPVDADTLWEAIYHQQTTPGQYLKSGGYVGNESYEGYLKYGYIPSDVSGRAHYSSSTLEYAYQDWCVAQVAKMTKRPLEDIELFEKRAKNWKNAVHPDLGLVRFKNRAGEWTDKSHCAESSDSQYRWHVPHDLDELYPYLGGEKAVKLLNEEFRLSEPMNFMAPGDSMKAIKINHGNQPMMHAGFLFNAFGKPELSQKWVRSIMDRYYGYTPYDAYLGDEDQGQMSAWLNLASIGLFSIDGGVGPDSIVELIPPSFEEVRLTRPHGADWIIRASADVVATGKADTVKVNGQVIENKRIPLKTLLSGKELVEIDWK